MKRGSALLIVLGLISFLVASAVAFSSWMRLARLPSSYLLRTSSSRSLVKAALAEALDEIDRAIADNPHPGVGTASSLNNVRNPTVCRNLWRDRVFFGTNMAVNVDTTVSTLTLEGLAYLPAPLINDVRYHSRRSPAAVWHELDFDSGRFAFTAVDVSDYFDVNRVMAAPEGGGRTSAANARVTLAYLFENLSHTGWRIQPDAWDTFMDNYLDEDPTAGTKVPLVSWADLNLAVWDKKPAGVISPWCRFIESNTAFVQDDPLERLALSNMVFVTDSWYPRETTASSSSVLDLSNGANQPFAGLNIRDKSGYRNRSVDELMRHSDKFLAAFNNEISPPERVQLCDYLDADSVPTSLVLPTTERVPMLTGVALGQGSALQLTCQKKTQTHEEKNQSSGVVTMRLEIDYYTLSLNGDLHPMVSAVYPFKHGRGSEDSESFSAQVAATVTLVEKGREKALRRPSAAGPAIFQWGSGTRSEAVGYDGNYKSLWALRSNLVPLNVNRNPAREEDCLIGPVDPQLSGFNFQLASTIAPSALVGGTTYSEDEADRFCTFRVVKKQEFNPVTGDPVGNQNIEVTKGFMPPNADLSGMAASNPNAVSDSLEFVPVIQLGVRVVNSSGDTVDMMPACVDDDVNPSEAIRADTVRSAFERPFLRFYDPNQALTVSFSETWFSAFTDRGIAIYPEAYVADDPRFNHAPEDLVAKASLGSEIQKYWLDNNTSAAARKDGDIFMAASDAGYLQSKFELSYLLNITGFTGTEIWGVLNNGGYDGVERTAFGNSPGSGAMWCTYSQYRVNGRAGDAIEKNFERVTSGDGGARVCPFTPDTAVMMGALANTPRDWWAASTNDVGSVKQQMLSSIDEALKYTLSDHSENAASRVTYKSMEGLAHTLIADFRAATTADGWRDVYDDLDWNGNGENSDLFRDLEMANSSVTFDSVDRKYLFGFWRECFAARQQLFLVFVRAEPMMMGGGAGGQMPPMLGARAVALVWRDPKATRINAPHRMRVLFYRQLD